LASRRARSSAAASWRALIRRSDAAGSSSISARSLRTVATDARCNSARRPALLNERPLASDCSFMPSTASVLTSTEPEAISPVSD
jgi:hypothetical protein